MNYEVIVHEVNIYKFIAHYILWVPDFFLLTN